MKVTPFKENGGDKAGHTFNNQNAIKMKTNVFNILLVSFILLGSSSCNEYEPSPSEIIESDILGQITTNDNIGIDNPNARLGNEWGAWKTSLNQSVNKGSTLRYKFSKSDFSSSFTYNNSIAATLGKILCFFEYQQNNKWVSATIGNFTISKGQSGSIIFDYAKLSSLPNDFYISVQGLEKSKFDLKLQRTSNTVTLNMTNYRYISQKGSGIQKVFGPVACVPTAYVIARGILSKNYVINDAKVIEVGKAMGTSLSNVGTNMKVIASYAKTKNEFGSNHPSFDEYNYWNDKTARTKTLGKISEYIKKGFPVIAGVGVNVGDPSNRDDSGHVVVITGFKTDINDNIVEITYSDPNDWNKLMTISVSQFLNSMQGKGILGGNIYILQRIGV